MRRVLIPFALSIVLTASAHQPAQKGAGPGKPLSPQDAQKLFKLDDGLRIELVACEPQIESPVAMQFDPDGRLWVVEMRDYPNGPAKGEKPAGRIRILEDKDGDGFFETSKIWADNLLFANGLLLWKDGAIVTMAPKVTHLRDTDGDGKADKEDVLYVGFAEQNPQLRVSHPIMGLDGWIYCANGLRGGKAVRDGPQSKEHKVIELSGMDFKFDPVDLSKYEAITGQGQFGNTFDEWGNRFVCDNRHHLRHIVMEQKYIKRNPYLAAPALIEDISVLEDGPLSSGGKVYPLSKNWTTSSLHEGRFTAACGVFIYQSGLLGALYRGAAFTCEPTGNLVHMEILKPKGATFESRPHRKGVEFLATTDDWFRPVYLTHGPEGALYIADMYRAVIEHPEFMPPELKNRPDLTAGKDKGRIWRIVPKDHQTKTPRPNLAKASIADLVKTLEHAEPWHRQTAQRLLLEHNDKAMIEPLMKLLATTKSPHAKILAAWMLERQGELIERQIQQVLRDGNPRVREHGLRIAESRFVSKRPNRDVHLMFKDEDARVRFQLALSLGGSKGDASTADILVEIASHKETDRWTRLAAQSALPQYAATSLFGALSFHPEQSQLIRELAVLVATMPDSSKEVAGRVRLVMKDFAASAKWACISGLAEGLERRAKRLSSIVPELPDQEQSAYAKDIHTVLFEAGRVIQDEKQPLEQRLMVLKVLGHASWPTAKETLTPLVEKEPNTELRIAALRALAAQQDKEVPALLIKLWPSAAPSLRREILEAMLRQPARVNVLLDEIESTRMKASELDPLRTRQLLNHKDAAIRERAKKLLAANVPAERAKVLAEYQAALKLKGDRVAGVGVDVGPDIADTRTKTEAAMLNDILVPNAAIDANYVNYVVTTKEGRVATGMLAVETASSITLKRAENQTEVVLRKDVEEIQSSGISLMPDGFEKQITVREMADLLRFLKDWRYLDGSVPVP